MAHNFPNTELESIRNHLQSQIHTRFIMFELQIVSQSNRGPEHDLSNVMDSEEGSPRMVSWHVSYPYGEHTSQ
jgi:hypothetical protein